MIEGESVGFVQKVQVWNFGTALYPSVILNKLPALRRYFDIYEVMIRISTLKELHSYIGD